MQHKTFAAPKAVRLSMARLVDERMKNISDLDEEEFRLQMWGLNQIISALKLEKDVSNNEDYQELIRRLEAGGL